MTIGLSFLLALLVSAALVPVGRRIARRLGYTSPPIEPGRGVPRARFGGVAIAVTLFACAPVVGSFAVLPVLFTCGIALCLFGVASEALRFTPSSKLLVQIAVASIFLLFEYRLYWATSDTLDSIITVFWIVGITSAFNLLDNMDGLCGGIALIAGTAFLFAVEPVGPLVLQAQYLAVVLGAVAGFLIYNVHPASVLMGESGSLLIGLNMAAMPLQFAPGHGSDLLLVVAVPVLLLLIPIADAALSTLSRLAPGGLDASAGAHSSRRLVALGLSERAAVGLLWLLAAVSGAIGVVAERTQQGLAGVAAAIFTVGLALGAVFLARVQFRENADVNRLSGTIVPLGIELGYWRRLAEALLDVLLVSVAYYGAYRLRFEGTQYVPNFVFFLQSLPVVLGMQVAALFAVGAYRGLWRYFSLTDGVTFGKGVLLGVVAAPAGIVLLYGFEGYSQSVFVIYGALLMLLLVGSRASFRLLSEFVHKRRPAGRRLVIYGADDAGSAAVRHLLNDPGTAYRIVGFVDDNARKQGVRIHGYPVIGGYDHLAGMIMAGEVDAVALTDEGTDTPDFRWLCAEHGVRVRRLAVDWREIRSLETPATTAPPVVVASREGPSETIRVVHIITRLILGGAQQNTIATAIGQHGDPRFDVTVVCGVDEAGEGNMFNEVVRAGVRTVVMPSLVREIRPFTDAKAFFDLYRFLTRGRYTIVHTHSSKAGIIGRLAAHAARVPIVVHTLHGLAFHDFQASWKNWLYVALKRICAPMTDKLISVSDRVSETALMHRIGRPDQYVTIHSGIELDLFLSVGERLSVEDAKRRVGIPASAPVVGKIARLYPLKGHEQFLAAAAVISRQVPDAYFLLVGDGPLRDQLRADAAGLGLGDRVIMVGRVPSTSVPEYIQAMDVVVHTSLREGIPRVLPQAGAVSKPVVTFDLDGAPEVIRHGVSGYLVPPVDVNGIAERTIELLRDPERCRAFGKVGRTVAIEQYSVEGMVEQTTAVYLDLVTDERVRQHA